MDALRKYSILAAYWLIIFFYPAMQFVLLVGFFVFADSVTGAIAANKQGTFNSKKFRSVVPKYIVFGIAVLTAHLIQQVFFHDIPAMKLVAGLIAYGELISIDENIKIITGKSLFTFFIKKLKQ